MSAELLLEPLEPSRRVLLVEDDAALRVSVGEAMRDVGLTVIEVASADEARRYLQAGGRAELVFSDVEMPGSMDGIALGRWVTQAYPEIGLILTSGRSAEAAADLGFFIAKPYSVFQVAEIARRTMDARRGKDR